MPAALTIVEFIARSRAIHGDKYDYSSVVYVNLDTHVIIICPEHGQFKRKPYSHLTEKRGCNKCTKYHRPTTEEWIAFAQKIHGNRYGYEEVVYTGNKRRVTIRCPIHGLFSQIASVHTHNKGGCARCAGVGRLTTETFIEKAIEVHGNKYDYSKVVYVDSVTHVTIICQLHGEFVQIAACHLQNHGCPKCWHSSAQKTWLEKYGVEHPFELKEIQDKRRDTIIEKYGVEHQMHSDVVKDTVRSTNIKRYGVSNPFQNPEITEKIRATTLERYGVPYATQCESVKEKIRETCLERFGCYPPLQHPDIASTSRASILERYGVEYIAQAEEIKAKARATMMDRFGVPHAIQCEAVKAKVRATCMEKYGSHTHMHDPAIAERCSRKAYKMKEYTFPCGTKISVQGYEPFALDLLVSRGLGADSLVTSRKLVPEIWYSVDGSRKRYYPDIFVPSDNVIIEVKSTWTYTKSLTKAGSILLKAQACIEANHDFIVWVFDARGNLSVKTIEDIEDSMCCTEAFVEFARSIQAW